MDIEDVKLRFADEGYCVFPGVLDAKEAERLEHLCRDRMQALGMKGGHPTGGGPNYKDLGGGLNEVPELAPTCVHPIVMDVCEALLGPDFQLANNVAVRWAQPGTEAGNLHADWPLRAAGWTPDWAQSAIPPIGGLQVFWMLSDGTAENGTTRVVPFSHHTQRQPSRPSYPCEVPIEGKRGTLFIFHNGLWHGIGGNTTSDQHRVFANPFYVPASVYRPPGIWPLVPRDLYDTFPTRLQELLARTVADPVPGTA